MEERMAEFIKKDSLKMEERMAELRKKHSLREVWQKKKEVSQEKDEDFCRDRFSELEKSLLTNILSRLTLKEAVATSILSPKWRFVWQSLKTLDFVGPETLHGDQDQEQERTNFINQVNSVTKSLINHNRPMVQSFKIRYNLDKRNFKDIDNWIRFSLDTKAEVLELDFVPGPEVRDTNDNYDFPLPLSDRSMLHLPSSSSMAIETFSFKEISLMHINVSDIVLKLLVEKSPDLETLYILGGCLLTDVNLGGPGINMKVLVLIGSAEIKSICLYDFDLEEFHFKGRDDADVRLTNLPNLKEIDIGMVSLGLNNNVFNKISSVASYLKVLSLEVDRELEDIEVEKIPQVLPNVKTLKLTLPTEEVDDIMAFIHIARRCPKLKKFIVSLHWFAPITENKAKCLVNDHVFSQLEHFEIDGFRGLGSDCRIFAYMIGNAGDRLKTIVIDPSIHPYDARLITKRISQNIKRESRRRATKLLLGHHPDWARLHIL